MPLDRYLIVLVTVTQFLFTQQQCSFTTPLTGEQYWNSLYGLYSTSDRFYGMWSHQCGYASRFRTTYDYWHRVSSGCSADEQIRFITCAEDRGSTVSVRSIGFFNDSIGQDFFYSDVTQISIINVPLRRAFRNTFSNNLQLTHLTIHDTKLEDFPDFESNTKLQWVDLSRNNISFFPNHTRQHLPPSVTHVNLIENKISWIPPDLFSGTNISFLALSSNEIGPVIPLRTFFDMPNLRYLSFDGNNLTELSKYSLQQFPTLIHLNLSNNEISQVQANAFQGSKQLKIIELHGNKIGKLGSCVFNNLPDLLHIDLNHNEMTEVVEKAFSNLPSLKTLRLHNQQITHIHPQSLHNINALEEIFVSSNLLTLFPHQVFEYKNWTSLRHIHADNNAIRGLVEYSATFEYGINWQKWRRLNETFEPFRDLSSLQTLFLHNNQIANLEEKTLCNIPALYHLSLGGNHLTSYSIHPNLFKCVPQLGILNLESNRFQFIPEAIADTNFLKELTILYLQSNKISFIRPKDFTTLIKLQQLFINSNNIYTVENGAFPSNLTTLHMSANMFNFKHNTSFNNLTLLTSLYLDHNRIDHLPRDAFWGLDRLSRLELHNNRIPFLPKEFLRDSTFVLILSLSSNEITFIEANALTRHTWNGISIQLSYNWIVHFPSQNVGALSNRTLTYLQLNYNRIERIQSFSFRNIQFSHTGLDLSNNKISTIESNALVSTTSGIINLNGNVLKDIRTEAFVNVEATHFYMQNILDESLPTCLFQSSTVNYLYMNSGFITNLSPTVFCAITVSQTLHLESNQITAISSPLFSYSSYVYRLNLQGNAITELSETAFEGASITILHLESNQIAELPDELKVNGLQRLYLSSNLIVRLRPGVFNNLTNLRYLYMDNNQITVLRSELFDSQSSLEILSFANNDITVLETGFFSLSGFQALRTLYLGGNQIKHMPHLGNLVNLRWLDLDSNPDLKTFEIGSLDSVSSNFVTLGLSGVELSCNCDMIKTLYPVEQAIVGGKCEQQGVSLSSLKMTINVTENLFLCSGENYSAYVTKDKELSLTWSQPSNLFYQLSNTSGDWTVEPVLEPVSLEQGVDCSCRELVANSSIINSTSLLNETATNGTFFTNANMSCLNSTTSTENATNPNCSAAFNETVVVCGTHWSTSQECIDEKISYSVKCSSEGSSFTYNVTNTTLLIKEAQPGSTYQCRVSLLYNNTESSPTAIIWLQVPELELAESCNNTKLWKLPVTYYDFSKLHPDFGNNPVTSPSSVFYIASPVTVWLADLDNPNNTGFQDWFRNVSGINFVYQELLYLKSCEDNGSYRYFNSTYYPLDFVGYQHESQRNCSNELHNMGFTSAIRTAFTYEGPMSITLGGGEYMFLFIGTKLVATYASSGNNLRTECVMLNVGLNERGLLKVERSFGNIRNQTCVTESSQIISFDLEVQIGDVYQFDLFHVERDSCSSEFLFETLNVQFSEEFLNESTEIISGTDSAVTSTATPLETTTTNVIATTITNGSTTSLPPNDPNIGETNAVPLILAEPHTDLFLTLPENMEVGSYVVTFGLGRKNGSFRVEMSDENGAGDFFQLTAENRANLTNRSFFALQGNQRNISNQTFLDCSSLSDFGTTVPPPVGTVVFTNDSLCHVFLRSRLDFETAQFHLLNITVEDILLNHTNFLIIKINVEDTNDNCPEVNASFVNITLLNPSLSTHVPMFALSAVDVDSFDNSLINYIHSEPSVRQKLEMSSILYFEVVAYDSGSPTLGRSLSINIEISDTCLYDSFGHQLNYFIELESKNNSGTAKFFLRLPTRYALTYDCTLPVGIESGTIGNSAIRVSSARDTGECGHVYHGHFARLNRESTFDKHGFLLVGAWVAEDNDTMPWIEVSLEESTSLTSIATQGFEDFNFWLTHYYVTFSNDGVNWLIYIPQNSMAINDTGCFLPNTEEFESIYSASSSGESVNLCLKHQNNVTGDIGNLSYVIRGNDNSNSTVKVDFNPTFIAKYVRLYPIAWHSGIGLRLELFGCVESRRLTVESKCYPCPTTYYCPGDGTMLPCGRCPTDDNSTSLDPADCGRSSTEHSFGAAEACEACPLGYTCKNGLATRCPKFTFTEVCNATECSACTPCEAGHSCLVGVMTSCQPGRFSEDGQTDYCFPCPSGTFTNISSSTACSPCASGYQSTPGSMQCFPCMNQEWSKAGSAFCEPCFDECKCKHPFSPCFQDVECINIFDVNSTFHFMCLDCPRGFTGDGVNCTDEDECASSTNPCFSKELCVNTYGGFHCEGCPIGYQGDFYAGFGVNDTSPKQVCQDIDECAHDACDPLVSCANTVGSYICDPCPDGYTGSGYSTCTVLNPCLSLSMRCNHNATCRNVNFNNAICECEVGGTGPGVTCGTDDDADGQPDFFISCADIGRCAQDNCLGIPNSGQEDTDGDRFGDACDNDDDGDLIPDLIDNCPLVANYVASGSQLDTDGDGFGDECDTCPHLPGQFVDTDSDGFGDACDDDDDNDGVSDALDLCPLESSVTLGPDADVDGVGDLCDNCPNHSNPDQLDMDQNGVGDACDNGIDVDGDGVINDLDNCPTIPNPSQSDYDVDGLGDSCDPDIDGDGVEMNGTDFCAFYFDTTAINDSACRLDFDADGVNDAEDTCPKDPSIVTNSFERHTLVEINAGTPNPRWRVLNQGREITQTVNSSVPSLLIGQQRYGSMNFTGGIFVNEESGTSNYIGLVFGYQSNRKFYLVLWRGYDDGRFLTGTVGMQIKAVSSTTGTGAALADALWYVGDTTGQTETLYHDRTLAPWNHKVPYLFRIIHRASIGLIRVIIFLRGEILIDSGPVYDTRYNGGRVGVISFQQGNVIWSNLQVKCVDRENTALRLGIEIGYVLLPNNNRFHFEDSFTIDAFVNLDAMLSNSTQPIICTSDGTILCLAIVNRSLGVSFGSNVTDPSKKPYFLVSDIPIVSGAWHHVTTRFDASACELSVLLNATNKATLSNVEKFEWAELSGNRSLRFAIGWDGTKHFQGMIDDVRIYDRALGDTEIAELLTKTGMTRHMSQKILTGHYDMNHHDYTSKTLRDRSQYNNDGELIGKTSFGASFADVARFEITG